MEHLAIWQLVFCALVIVASFTVRGGTGFGGATMAIPLLVLVAPLSIAVVVLAVLNIAASYEVLRRDWRKIHWGEIRRLLPFSTIGIVVGIYLMSVIDERLLAKGLGVFIIAYAIYALWTAENPYKLPSRLKNFLAVAIGSVAGFVGTIFGSAAGPMYAIYMNLVQMEREAFRLTITAIISVGLVMRAVGYGAIGFVNKETLIALAAAFPLMYLGGWLGGKLLKNINQKRFGQLVASVLIISGLSLVLK